MRSWRCGEGDADHHRYHNAFQLRHAHPGKISLINQTGPAVNAAEDLYPNPRYRLYRPPPMGQKSQHSPREPTNSLPVSAFSIGDTNAAAKSGMKIG
jgi:hypothetical protein